MFYASDFVESIEKPVKFWEMQSDKISWFQTPENILTKDELNHIEKDERVYKVLKEL